MVVVMVVIVWLLIRCGPADETHRAARATHAQSPRRQDTCHPDDRPTRPGISWPRGSPRPRSLTAYHPTLRRKRNHSPVLLPPEAARLVRSRARALGDPWPVDGGEPLRGVAGVLP